MQVMKRDCKSILNNFFGHKEHVFQKLFNTKNQTIILEYYFSLTSQSKL